MLDDAAVAFGADSGLLRLEVGVIGLADALARMGVDYLGDAAPAQAQAIARSLALGCLQGAGRLSRERGARAVTIWPRRGPPARPRGPGRRALRQSPPRPPDPGAAAARVGAAGQRRQRRHRAGARRGRTWPAARSQDADSRGDAAVDRRAGADAVVGFCSPCRSGASRDRDTSLAAKLSFRRRVAGRVAAVSA
ncbi:hypothetical protein FE772_03885 [Lysobacter enzymogenes]|nr:hypothetical protein [Lysobacter enzymogenes]QCW24937.1 hypothetical protein FE772_03885 [Lysobacter enzymogenes]